MKSCKGFGILLIIMSGFMYTLERGFSMLSTSLVQAGFYSGRMTGQVPEVEVNGLFSNFFVPLFLVIGSVLVIYGVMKRDDR